MTTAIIQALPLAMGQQFSTIRNYLDYEIIWTIAGEKETLVNMMPRVLYQKKRRKISFKQLENLRSRLRAGLRKIIL
jgi:hypothetical protein